MTKDRHVMEALGKTRVIIEDGKVVEVGEPQVDYCPLFFKHRGIEKITAELVRQNIEFRIKDFGMCAPGRKMRMRDFLSFGISELMGMCVAKGILDCAVVVCDGSGTAIVTDPELVQGIGGRISGLVETSPIDSVIAAIGKDNVLDPATARIDQVAGARLAWDLGFRKIGVTVAKGNDAVLIRKELGESVVLFAVHTSGLDEGETKMLLDTCDVVTACASKHVWRMAKESDAMQVGTKVPVFALTQLGKDICSVRLQQMNLKAKNGPEDPPRPLI
ncbi:MAG: DUF2099 family protein [Methanomassiliicoccales archaeon]|nr:DUF2099 family protein [Methanomassiliicoccales archaeon]